MTVARITAMTATIPKEKVAVMDLGFDSYLTERTIKLTGVKSVRYAPDNMTALDYCLDAAKRILDAGYASKDDIDGIIFVTPHSDYVYPGNCSIIQSRLGLPKRCIAMDINHLCSGMVYGVFVADLLVRTNQCKNVLVCCGDTASHHIHKDDRTLRMTIGDGGVAALVSSGSSSPIAYAFQHDGDGLEYLYTPAGGERMPRQNGVTNQETTDAAGNVRTLEDEYMDGMQVMKYALGVVPPLVNDVLTAQNWEKDSVDIYSFHQVSTYMIKTLAGHMRLPKENVLYDVDGNGNIGGGSVALAICHAAMEQQIKADKVVMVGFGAGLSTAAMAVDMSETDFLPVNEI